MRPSLFTMCLLGVVTVVLPSCHVRTGNDPEPGTDPPLKLTEATVTRVVDGDTIHVSLEGRDTIVRIIGIDTPERDGPYTHEECFGREASAYTNSVLDGTIIGLEFDVEHTDRYDRALAYVWVGDELFDERILRDGYAVLLTVPPNVRYVDRFTEAQDRARDAGRGLWGSCPAGV
jgi:micrococcal nuclease